MATVGSLTFKMNGLNLSDLDQLREEINKQIDTQVEERKIQIVETFGDRFTNIVGVGLIDSLPEVSAESLKLDGKVSKYPGGIVKPSDLDGHSAVRSIMGDKRPVIALTIELLSESKEIQAVRPGRLLPLRASG